MGFWPYLFFPAGVGNDWACGLKGSCYSFTQDLLRLNALSEEGVQASLPSQCMNIATPLKVAVWRDLLSAFPDRKFADYIVQGIENGFCIGADRAAFLARSANRNMPSAREHADIISTYLELEVARGRMAGPLIDPVPNGVLISPMGIIPKPHQPGKWRLIINLSAPQGASVNDMIPPELCSPRYPRLDEVAAIIMSLGPGTLLAKLDLESAYRLVPIHPRDRSLLAVKWEGGVYMDGSLPFGLRSAPKIFSAVADALLWIMFKRGVECGVHYLDDFLVAGPPGSPRCASSLGAALETCEILGVPVAAHKTVLPATTLTFLGIEIDTVAGQLLLPQEKLLRLKATISSWKGRKKCTKQELLSLIGQLHHAASVVKPGRSFLRRMINLSMVVSQLHYTLRLNGAFRADLEWWDLFLEEWNGISLVQALGKSKPDHVVQSDASGSWGCGARWSTHWFQTQWPPEWLPTPIAVKELLAVVLAAAAWGSSWQGAHILFECDNMAVVFDLGSGTSKQNHIMHLLRALHFIAAHHQFSYQASHIRGSSNIIADSLSRETVSMTFLLSFQADAEPSPFPWDLMQLLLNREVCWWTLDWRQLFANSIRRASPRPLNACTSQPKIDS